MGEQEGIVIKYNIALSRGVIQSTGGETYDFSLSDLLEGIADLDECPPVYFQAEGDRAVKVRNNFDMEIKCPIHTGSVFLGAAKCPNCTWRLPMFPEHEQAYIRRGYTIECPQCQTPLWLKSMFKRFHTSVTWGLAVAGFMAAKSMLQWWGGAESEQRPLILVVIAIVLMIFVISFFYVYLQEELIEDDYSDAQ